MIRIVEISETSLEFILAKSLTICGEDNTDLVAELFKDKMDYLETARSVSCFSYMTHLMRDVACITGCKEAGEPVRGLGLTRANYTYIESVNTRAKFFV